MYVTVLCVCMFVCMYVCMYVCISVSVCDIRFKLMSTGDTGVFFHCEKPHFPLHANMEVSHALGVIYRACLWSYHFSKAMIGFVWLINSLIFCGSCFRLHVRDWNMLDIKSLQWNHPLHKVILLLSKAQQGPNHTQNMVQSIDLQKTILSYQPLK